MGIATRVIDLRTLAPLDLRSVAESVAQTRNLVVVHEDNGRCGLGASIIAEMCGDRELWRNLTAPPRLVAGKDAPVGFHEDLERAVLPSEAEILAALREAVGGR